MLGTGFAPWPSYSEEEAIAVSNVLLSNKVNYWTGEECRHFEREFAAWCGSKYAISLSNGTVALEIALRAVGVSIGDEVIVTPRTFIASASAIVAVGAIPVFAEIDQNSQNITADSIKKVLTKKTKAVVCVHLAGWPCDMDPIIDLATSLNLKIVEDCAQAHGAIYKGRSVGTIGHVGAWSFCQDKIMTTGGEGGMVTTNDEALWRDMWAYKDHGKSYEAIYERKHPPGFRWTHESFGSNARMIEMQAAIGRIQLKKIDEWHITRKKNCEAIWAVAQSIKALRVPTVPHFIEHAYYKCYVFLRKEFLAEGWSRDRILSELNDKGIPCMSGSCSEIYLEKAFDGKIFKPVKRMPVSQDIGESSIMFLVHPTLTEEQIQMTCNELKNIMHIASK